MQNRRLTYLDSAKGLLILLVVVGHILIVLNPKYDRLLLTAAQEFITCFHMPAFFLIHGMLLAQRTERKPWKTLIGTRIKTLLVPYIFFEVLGILCRLVLYGQPLRTGLYNLIIVRCNVGADWFLPALFMSSLAAECFCRYGRRNMGWLLVAAGTLLAVVMPDNHLGIVLTRGIMGFIFVMLGMLIPEKVLIPRRKTALWFTAFFFVTAACAVLNLKLGGNDFFSGLIGNVCTLLLGGICGSGMCLILSQWINFRLLQRIGKESLVIMGTHQLVIYVLMEFIPDMRGGHLLWGVVLLVIIAVIELLVIPAFNSFCPQLIGKRTYLKKRIWNRSKIMKDDER